MSKYSILFVSATSEIGGADICLLDIIRKLDQTKYNPIVVFPFTGPLVEEFKEKEVRVIFMNTGYIRRSGNPLKIFWNILRLISSVLQMVWVIKKWKIKLVHSNSSIVFGGAFAAKIIGVKNVWHVREIKTSPQLISTMIRKIILYTADKIITISDAVKNSFSESNKSRQKVITIYDGVDLENFYPMEKNIKLQKELKIDPEAKVVGSVGLILPLKGYEYLIEAAEEVVRRFSNAVFLIVGDTVIDGHNKYREKLKLLASKLGISKNVIFTGMRRDIPKILSLVDVFVLPSIEQEGLGRVLIEAMALKKPVVTTSIGGQSEVVQNNVNGLLVPPKNSQAITEAIIDLLQNDAKAKRLGEEGYRKVKQSFDLDINIRKFEELLENLIVRKG
jgi:glycosyltransferase involved in cell wall biosynthesis